MLTETRTKQEITNEPSEELSIVWDGERFALIHKDKTMPDLPINKVIILNPREAKEISDFIRG